MNALDIVFLAIIVVFLIWGLFRGLVKEIVTTAGVLAAYWVANTYYRALAPETRYWLSDPTLMSMTAYFALFVGTFVAAWIVSYILVKLFRIMPPGWIEFPGGAVFGAAKGALICAVALVSLHSFMPGSSLVENSALAKRLEPVTKVLTRFASEHMTGFDASALKDDLARQGEEFQEQHLGGSKKASGRNGGDGRDDTSIPDEVREMKDKILKQVNELMDQEKQ